MEYQVMVYNTGTGQCVYSTYVEYDGASDDDEEAGGRGALRAAAEML